MTEREFPPGPWDDEPDRVDWHDEDTGLPCIALRSRMGSWCGYVGVPPEHPLHGKDYFDLDINVHGGLTYGEPCSGHVCHTPRPGESDDVWWYGFDCAHAFDIVPGLIEMLPAMIESTEGCFRYEYRTIEYVMGEVKSLAKQLHEVKSMT